MCNEITADLSKVFLYVIGLMNIIVVCFCCEHNPSGAEGMRVIHEEFSSQNE